MKKTFLTNMLPMIAAAVILATSCSKDNDSDNKVVTTPDNTVPIQEQVAEDNQTKTIPFSITVGRDATLSKATVDESSLTQKFEAGDGLVISGTGISGTLTLKSGAGEATATFEGTLSGDGVENITDETALTATLTNENSGNTGEELTAVQSAESLSEAFQKYGYWTASFTYGARNNVELVQNTAFVRVNLPFHGTKLNVKIGETTTSFYLNGDEILAVPNGATISCTLLGINKTVDISEGKVVLNIKNRTTPDDCIAGVFSVSEDKQIFFSKGTLQYNPKNSSWRFALNQYDKCHNSGDKVGINYASWQGDDKWTDIFGWGMWQEGQTPNKTSGSNNDYLSSITSGEFSGNAAIGSQWQTLSTSEWQYLLGSRDGNRYVMAQVNNMNGIILLPDNWSNTALNNYNTYDVEFSINTITSEQWIALESVGAVFLPAVGTRNNTDAGINAGITCAYWSSSTDNGAYAKYVLFKNKSLKLPDNGYRWVARAVRLVRGL